MTRQTSIDVYNKIKSDGLLGELQWIVYDYLWYYGPATQGETWEHVRKCRKMNSSGCITSRFAELKKMGALQEVCKRNCKITGRKVLEWDVTDRIPSSLDPILSNKEKIRLMSLEIEGLKAENQGLKRLLNQKQVGQGFLGF